MKEREQKSTAGKGKPKFFTMLLAFSILPLILSIAVISTLSIEISKKNMESSSEQKLYIVASNLANHCKENNITFATTDQYNDYLDSLLENKIQMAILLDGCPAVTSIKNESGYRVREIPCAKTIADDAELFLAGGFYDNEVVVEDITYCAYYLPIMRDNDIIGIAMAAEEKSAVTGDIQRVLIMILVISIVMFAVFTVACVIAGKKIEKGFLQVNRDVDLLAAGDLNSQEKKKNAIREMDALAVATAKMQSNLASTIGQVKSTSDSLIHSVNDVVTLSQNSTDRAQMITSSMEEVARGSVDMTENVSSINEQMEEIGTYINEIADQTGDLYQTSNSIIATNEMAKESMQVMLDNAKLSVDAVSNITKQIVETNDSIAEIDSVVDFILNIADQTSLLSLNASIEAARAGENGRGFAVVADEIRKLAEQSSEGAAQIREMSLKISEKSEATVVLASQVQELINEEQNNIDKTKNSYEQLSDKLTISVDSIRNINTKTAHLNKAKELIIGNIHELSAISEENTAVNEEVTANVIQIISDFADVNKNCEAMNGMASELEESISFFRFG